MDREYWESFYQKKQAVEFPSSFADFCCQSYIPQGSVVLELGSGNGRDARYFFKNKNSVIAIDQSAIDSEYEITRDEVNTCSNYIRIIKEDFVHIDYSRFDNINIIYSRFTMHAISDAQEDLVVEKAYDALPSGGLFLIEARTIRDSLYGLGELKEKHVYFTDHYRRFIDTHDFIQKVVKTGFRLVYFIESSGLSIYKGEDPILMRVVLKKVRSPE